MAGTWYPPTTYEPAAGMPAAVQSAVFNHHFNVSTHHHA
jgi:hypothetical protein